MSLAAIKQCAITFIAIFALLYVRGVLSLRHAQGAALLKSENVGEKPPKSQWLLVIPGLALLLGAYYIAATINDPGTGDAALLPRGHHGHSIDVSSLHLRQRDALQNTPEG
ncbi:MAG: hypothetical protein ACLRSD_16990 [Oscillibacter sp.]